MKWIVIPLVLAIQLTGSNVGNIPFFYLTRSNGDNIIRQDVATYFDITGPLIDVPKIEIDTLTIKGID